MPKYITLYMLAEYPKGLCPNRGESGPNIDSRGIVSISRACINSEFQECLKEDVRGEFPLFSHETHHYYLSVRDFAKSLLPDSSTEPNVSRMTKLVKAFDESLGEKAISFKEGKFKGGKQDLCLTQEWAEKLTSLYQGTLSDKDIANQVKLLKMGRSLDSITQRLGIIPEFKGSEPGNESYQKRIVEAFDGIAILPDQSQSQFVTRKRNSAEGNDELGSNMQHKTVVDGTFFFSYQFNYSELMNRLTNMNKENQHAWLLEVMMGYVVGLPRATKNIDFSTHAGQLYANVSDHATQFGPRLLKSIREQPEPTMEHFPTDNPRLGKGFFFDNDPLLPGKKTIADFLKELVNEVSSL